MADKLRHTFLDPRDLVIAYLPSFSGGGLFLPTEHPLELWSEVALIFNLPGLQRNITCRVEVLWVNLTGGEDQPGMGVRFLDMAPEDRAALDEYLKLHARRDELLAGRYHHIFPADEADEPEPAA